MSPHQASVHWDAIAPMFERMEREYDGPMANVMRDLAESGNAQIWGFDDGEDICGVLATEVVTTGRGKVCNVMCAFGRVPTPLQERMLDEIGKWATDVGCVAVRLQGRKGWVRRFPRLRQVGIVAEWQLTKAH